MSTFSPAPALLHTYFENPVGRVLEHPVEHYIRVEYRTGPRQAGELQAFLNHAGELLAQHGWDKFQHYEGSMAALTPEEITSIANYWSTQKHSPTDLYAAMLLPHEVFAQLSWKGNGLSGRPLAAFIKSDR
ncbi:hypothetical protein [Hymenobacter bucti]|uniref:Uncharacterized protein n=1 Tax=Hymenobacter bucti TaxID=1844114 RepID=A0ABW4QYU3_9BACT